MEGRERKFSMKRYNEYTTKELANLTDEQIKQLIEIECMVKGVSSYYEKPVLKEIRKLPEPDIEAFEVAGILLLDKDEAISLLELMRNLKSVVRTDYDYGFGYGYQIKYIKPDKDYCTLTSCNYYTKDLYDTMKDTMKRNGENEAYNKEVSELYNSKMQEYFDIEAEVNEVVCRALAHESKVDYAKKLFKRYVEMSDGNVEVAKNFFGNTEYSCFLDRVLEENKADVC